MIGEVLDGRADFAIADLSITSERAAAIKFTMPWMNLGQLFSTVYVLPKFLFIVRIILPLGFN